MHKLKTIQFLLYRHGEMYLDTKRHEEYISTDFIWMLFGRKPERIRLTFFKHQYGMFILRTYPSLDGSIWFTSESPYLNIPDKIKRPFSTSLTLRLLPFFGKEPFIHVDLRIIPL